MVEARQEEKSFNQVKESMHLMRSTTSKNQMLEPSPFGPGFAPEEVERAEYMEIWGSSFDESGTDYCLFKLFKNGENFAVQRVHGY
jgi:hypothetical protein